MIAKSKPSFSLYGFILIISLSGCTIFEPADLPDTYIVFFQAADPNLSAEAKGVIHQAAEAIRGKHPKQVVVEGEPTTVPVPGSDPRLADPQFGTVELALIAEGIDPKLLARASLTDDQANVDLTGYRRIEIHLYGTN